MEELGIEIFIKTRNNLPSKYKLVSTDTGLQCLTNKEIIQKRSIFWIYNIDDINDLDMNIVPDTVIPRSLFLCPPLYKLFPFDYSKGKLKLNFNSLARLDYIIRPLSKKNNTYSNYNSNCKCGMCNSKQSNGKLKFNDLMKSSYDSYGQYSYDKYYKNPYDQYSYYKNAMPYKSDNYYNSIGSYPTRLIYNEQLIENLD